MKHFLTFTLLLLCSLTVCAQTDRNLPIPLFPSDAQRPINDVLKERRSIREYADRAIDDATLSCLLWAACGVSEQKTGKITAPSAINKQDINVYVCTAEGVWRYDAQGNKLIFITKTDLRKALAGFQQFAATAPINLLLVSRTNEFGRRGHDFGCMDAGYVSQNIYLACTALGLGTVARASMEVETVIKELGLKEGEEPMLNHPVGFLK